jgi:hypothetical protein
MIKRVRIMTAAPHMDMDMDMVLVDYYTNEPSTSTI